MKGSILKAAVCAMSMVFVSGLALIPAGKVSADVERMIKPEEQVAVDFLLNKQWTFTYDSSKDTKGKFIRIRSTGSTDTYVTLCNGETDEVIESDDGGAEDESNNFSLTRYLKPGLYKFYVMPYGLNDPNPNNDTKVYLEDLTNEQKVADINSTNFPNTTFREYIDKNFDIRDDGYLSKDEIAYAKKIDVYNYYSYDNGIDTLKGIEFFTDLEVLSCSNNKIQSLNLNSNTKLRSLNCYDCKDLTTVVLDKCKNLAYIHCYRSNISSLTLTQCKMLRAIHCYNTPLTSLDLSNLKNIYEIYCYDCNLNTLNVSGCTGLEKLLCNNNQLASLDVSGASNLSELDCKINDLKSIKLNKKIETLFLDNNADLKSVDLTGCSRLRVLVTVGTGITNINISSCPKLEAAYSKGPINPEGNEYSTVVNAEEYRISCNLGTNIITKNDPTDKVVDINETNFPDQFLRQRLSTYDLDGDGALNALELRSITKLDLNYNYKDLTGIGYLTYLEELYISNCENLKEVDLSKNVNLENLICFYNPDLSKLALPDSGRIISVQCNDNALKSLDLSKCTGLEALECSNNPISKLDVSKNINLETLICRSNNLTVLDISNNEKLAYLACFGNNIENLDISDNPKLVTAIMNGEKQTELSQGIEFLSYMDMDNECGIFIDAKTVVVSSKPTATPTATPTPAATATPASAPVTTAVPTKADPVSLTLNKKTAKVTCGKTLTLKATLTGSSDKITWKSSNTKIATVDASGKIKAKMAGEVTITATAAGKTAKCVVTVLYKDVTNTKDFWYAPTNYLTAKGVVKGYDKQTKFKPANDCTRAQMVTFLYRLQGEPKIKSTTCKFKDVKKTDYFFKPVIWAVEKGITTGVSKTKFKPKGVCTRAQTVTFLWRMAGKPDPKTKKNPFPDVKKKDYFYKATLWASEKKILAGMPDGTFNPQGKCLRRQMVTFLYKYDKFVNGKG